MKLLVYEYVSGGGFAGKPLPVNVLSEGFSMLRTLTTDFKAAGHSVSTVLDSRIAAFNPPIEADYIMPATSFQDSQAAIRKASEAIDAAYIVAPESNQVLETLVAKIEHTGVTSLNCSSSAIANVSDKAAMLKRVKETGLQTPTTVIVNASDDAMRINQVIRGILGFPLIIKPVNGVGCAGLSVVRNEQQLAGAVAKAASESSTRHFIAQELVNGTAVSASLFTTGSDTLPVSLNKQNVSLMPPDTASTYNGGQVPLNSPLEKKAFAAAKKVATSFQGLRGYVGVDLVLTENDAVIIEVNPRLTTSYVGLRKTASFNPAQALINTVVEQGLPADNQTRGYAVFSKLEMPKPSTVALEKTYRVNEVVAPPFPVTEADTACALVLAHGATLEEAEAGFHEAKKRLHSIIRSEGI